MNWFDLVPSDVAVKQVAWEREQRIKWAREHAGASIREISENLGISRQRVYGLTYKAGWPDRLDSPVVKWMRSGGELAEFFGKVRRMKLEGDRLYAEYRRHAGMLGYG